MILFTVASMACGFSPSLPALIAGRVLQGIGAAMITPTSLALFREAFHDPARRGRAIVYWDWRLIFFVNLPVGVAALLVLSRVAPSPHILLTFATCVASAAVFVAAQARGSHPMIPLDLFRSRAVSTALIVAGVTMAAFYGVVFLQSLYFQQERGASALETGLLFLPMTGLVALLNPLVARFAERFGRIVAIVSGQLLMAAGLASLCLLPGNAPTLLVAFLMVPVGVGGSFTVPPIIALILDHVPAELAGTASGAVNTARQLGGSLGVAIFGAALAGQNFMAGLRINLSITALLLLVLVAVSLPLRHAQQSRH
ncbi:MFS transporter [Arthrobacter bambusae]|uniref:MFS transporter n=1 Tax=Arthrobacter bambusae TaxID=1338426 RepID=UPI00277E8234|nr:MFS transporter [Arthrobacter bambusae]MDQ0238541.1 DHA2 family methylenomycin A resistance protein-like MFS transporter [Arthrobacter bambusae]